MSIILTEAEPVGGFVGVSLSEPLMQAGTLATVFVYMIVLQPWMALLSFMLFCCNCFSSRGCKGQSIDASRHASR
jgi:hypothetical protein